jgi:hypothetical protein
VGRHSYPGYIIIFGSSQKHTQYNKVLLVVGLSDVLVGFVNRHGLRYDLYEYEKPHGFHTILPAQITTDVALKLCH